MLKDSPKAAPAVASAPLGDADFARLQALLDALPPPLEPLDPSALDGYLCGVLLQPRRVPEAEWMPGVVDAERRAPTAALDLGELHALVRRRHAELDRAIGARQWFDPWIADLGPETSPAEAVLPWAAGFAIATEVYPALLSIDDAALVEPLAVLFMHFDPDDLEDADALLAVIDSLEPPSTLAEAAEDIVRSVLLIADVSRPRPAPSRPGVRRRRRPGRAARAPARRWRSGRRARAARAASRRRCARPAAPGRSSRR